MSQNRVYIATSLDGYIADSNGKVDFLDTFPFPEGNDMGYAEFMSQADAILMGRRSFETVISFGIPWPYQKPVFVWSQTLSVVPEPLQSNVFLVRGDVSDVLRTIHSQGFTRLYIDGGQVIQSFLRADLINEMIITTVPVLLGSGTPLFGEVPRMISFRCVRSETFSNGLVQCRFVRHEH